MLKILDALFLWLHIIIILFNLFGWIWTKTRRAQLIVVLSTLFSWLFLGIWYGLGYCFLTDWHWEVKYKLGEENLPASFIKYFLDQYTMLQVSAKSADWLTGVSFALAILISLYLNFKRERKTLN